jgi:hypothetical protein
MWENAYWLGKANVVRSCFSEVASPNASVLAAVVGVVVIVLLVLLSLLSMWAAKGPTVVGAAATKNVQSAGTIVKEAVAIFNQLQDERDIQLRYQQAQRALGLVRAAELMVPDAKATLGCDLTKLKTSLEAL